MAYPENAHTLPHSSEPVQPPAQETSARKPLIGRLVRHLPWAHFALGPAEVAIGLDQAAPTAVTDGVENGLDGSLYNEETRNIEAGDKGQEIQSSNVLARVYDKITGADKSQKRKFVYRVQFGSAIVVGGHGLYNLLQRNDEDPSALHISVTAASLAVAGITTWVGHRMKNQVTARQEHDPELAKDVGSYYDHARFDIWSSAVALAGAAFFYPLGLGAIEKVAGVIICTAKALRFRPTASNLKVDAKEDHGHQHDHHEHEDCGHFHLSEEAIKLWSNAKSLGGFAVSKAVQAGDGIKSLWQAERREKRELHKPRRWRTVLAAGATAVALGAGLTGSSADNNAEAEPSAPEAPVAVQPVQSPAPPEKISPQERAPFTETVQVDRGESQWSLAEERIESVTGQPAQDEVVKAVAALAAAENASATPNPHHINVGQELAVLSDEAVQAVYNAHNSPQSPLHAAVSEIVHAPWDGVIELVDEKSGIKAQIQQEVATSS